MAKGKFMCLAIDCENQVERDSLNFDTGFCDVCQNSLEKATLEILTPDWKV